MKMKKIKKFSAEEIYEAIILKKTPKEKLKIVNGLFDYAKKVNPEAFKWPKKLKPRQIY